MFNVLYHPDVNHRDLPPLDQKILRQIGSAIEKRLTTDPTRYGAPLRHTLKGYWKLRVGDYRVVYRIVGDAVRVIAILHRSRVYDVVSKRI